MCPGARHEVPCFIASTVYSFLTPTLDAGKWLASRPVRFYRGKRALYSLSRSLGRPRVWSGTYDEEKCFLPVSGIKPLFLDCPASILIIISPTLSCCGNNTGIRTVSRHDRI
jgi:hypothetical protein